MSNNRIGFYAASGGVAPSSPDWTTYNGTLDGSLTVVNSVGNFPWGVARLDDVAGKPRYLFGWQNGAGNDFECRIVEIDDTTITNLGSVTKVFDGRSHNYIRPMGNNKAACAFRNETTSRIEVGIVEVTGTTISSGTKVSTGFDSNFQISMDCMDSTYGVVAGSTSTAMTAHLFSVSGNVVTIEDTITITTDIDIPWPTVARSSDDSVVITYTTSINDKSRFKTLTRSGTTLLQSAETVDTGGSDSEGARGKGNRLLGGANGCCLTARDSSSPQSPIMYYVEDGTPPVISNQIHITPVDCADTSLSPILNDNSQFMGLSTTANSFNAASTMNMYVITRSGLVLTNDGLKNTVASCKNIMDSCQIDENRMLVWYRNATDGLTAFVAKHT